MSKRENPKKRERLTTLAENFNTFEERKRHLAFNFQFLTTGEGYGQSLEDWNKEGLLLDLNEKVKEFSKKTKSELLKDKTLAVYKEFPNNSHFKYPKSIPNSSQVEWARLTITGRRRLAGFFSEGADRESDIFYAVFLDKNHDFYPVEKKHT